MVVKNMKQLKLKELAKLADVSPATVSLVLNNREGVGEEKREVISKLLIENGYTIAERSSGEREKSIRFLKYTNHSMLVEGNPGFVNSIIDAIEKECRRQSYSLVMTSFKHKQLDEIVELLRDDPKDGVLLLGTEIPPEDLRPFAALTTPLVVVDNPVPFYDFSCVTMENRRTIYTTVSYLKDLGHKRVGFLGNVVPSGNCKERLNAYQETLKLLGMEYDPTLIYRVDPTAEGACVALEQMLTDGVKFPSALVANNDSIAIGAVKAFAAQGIRVPQDISIVSIDNIPFSAMSSPPLTTMDVSCTDMGIWAVRMLIDKIHYPHGPVSKMQIGTKLLVRDSTAPFDPGHNCPYVMG